MVSRSTEGSERDKKSSSQKVTIQTDEIHYLDDIR